MELQSVKAAAVISVLAAISNLALFPLPLSIRGWVFTPLNLTAAILVLAATINAKSRCESFMA